MSLKSFILQSLFVLLFCTSFLSALDIRLSPQEKNGLRWREGVKHSTTPTREALIEQAKAAMESIPKSRRPGMVSALWTNDGNIYFATSLRGQGKLPGDIETKLELDPRVSKALNNRLRYLPKPADAKHVWDGKCAEIMVIGAWYRIHHGAELPKSGKLIVAVNQDLQVTNPCSIEHQNVGKKNRKSRIGCFDFLTEMGFVEREIVLSNDPTHKPPTLACQIGRPLTKRGCVPKKPTAKHSPPGKSTAQAPRQGKPKPPSNNRPKSTPPKMPAKSKAPSNRGPKRRLPAKPKAPSDKGPKH
ncbi:hypothetical protein JOM56_013917 [Amanita muscaria]